MDNRYVHTLRWYTKPRTRPLTSVEEIKAPVEEYVEQQDLWRENVERIQKEYGRMETIALG